MKSQRNHFLNIFHEILNFILLSEKNGKYYCKRCREHISFGLILSLKINKFYDQKTQSSQICIEKILSPLYFSVLMNYLYNCIPRVLSDQSLERKRKRRMQL